MTTNFFQSKLLHLLSVLLKPLCNVKATWDLSEDGTAFESRGKFSSSISYNINQGARMTINEDHDLSINLTKGSKLPSDTQKLVNFIRRAMPVELFDPSA